MRALISQDVAYLESYSPGAVASDMLNEASIMQTGFSETLGVAIASLSVVLTSFIVAFTQSWKLTLVTGTSIVALFVFLHFTDRMQARLGGKISNIYTEAAGILEEALSSITVITALGAGKKFQRRYNTCLEAAKAATINKSPTSSAELGLAYFCFLAAFGLVFWYGIQLLLNGNLPNGGRIVMYLPPKKNFSLFR
jgi:ATP-binding cassette subfamily B (MDR/TAP) protein 1